MNRAETIAQSIADKLFSKRRGHGNSERIVERHLSHGQIKEIVKIAYNYGHADGIKTAQETKP
jgi:2-methylisocitrate lyase-like PEP mutase family enzyme